MTANSGGKDYKSMANSSVDFSVNESNDEFTDLDLNFTDSSDEDGKYRATINGDNSDESFHLLSASSTDELICSSNKNYNYEEQSSLSVLRQMVIPFTIAGFGSTFAGIVLHNITNRWSVFREVPQFEIMIPAFIGLIGNIETTLASRLSTHANLGTLDTRQGLVQILTGNALVVLCQASATGLFAALASLAVSWFSISTRGHLNAENALLLAASSMITSIIANTLLATLIILVVVVSRKFNVNPDNISTPVAASMGDVCSLSILALISQSLYEHRHTALLLTLITALLLIAPVLGYFARQNKFTKSVILTGWTAILGAVVVEQPGGMVMEEAFRQYKVMSTFQPLVNGIGSNLVGIQTSRMSTYLHSVTPKGQLPDSNPKYCVGPQFVFFSKDINAKIARLLLMVLVPSHLFYMVFIYALQSQFNFSVVLTLPFVLSYCTAITIQLVILLFLAYVSVFWAWKVGINPDNSAIPFTSALADVLGNCLMAAAFTFLHSINDPNAFILEHATVSTATTTIFKNVTINNSSVI